MLSGALAGRTKARRLKPPGSRFRLGGRKSFVTVRTAERWNSFPHAVVGSPSLAVFKQRLGGHLAEMPSQLPAVTGGGLDALQAPFSSLTEAFDVQ